MTGLRTRALRWMGRRYFRGQGHGRRSTALSPMSLLPDSALMPLRRDGLDPVGALRRTRERAPVTRLSLPFDVNVWLVTGYEESRAVLGDTDRFSNAFDNLIGPTGFTKEDDPGGLGFRDPPEHTRLRRILTPEFTMRRLARLRPRIQSIVDSRLDAIAAAPPPVDLMRTFALPIPALTICELLGVPYADRDEFQRMATDRFDMSGGIAPSLGAMSDAHAYLLEIVRRQRAEPGDDLLGAIVKEHGDDIGDDELAELADGLLTGGLETSASMIALGTIVLLRDHDWFKRVHDDDAAADRFVDEALRYLTVVQVAFPRHAREDVQIGDVTIRRGDIMICSLSAADRDPAIGPDPDRFDPDRPTRPHLAFSHGPHRCIGAELGRLELRVAYPSLVRRFPQLRLATDPIRLPYRKGSIVYGLDQLPVIPE